MIFDAQPVFTRDNGVCEDSLPPSPPTRKKLQKQKAAPSGSQASISLLAALLLKVWKLCSLCEERSEQASMKYGISSN